ncbi:hypothetical protein K353_02243 [Kitasatospora sp. SolWspMP-SS2h]|uniref:hypothetical protein n=1 Tax=Kitasatospora sp. SolWspMP-SS2h TaxID=1305729 RepID=UPI000DBAB916|nr:hypothetical protein [Kitasatospora sp. SolWspMP-SS2h]RAJ43220.1 hypothetical protein K353_02243 [Kitasatospora sp. SolWspMP-SS2h]
MLAAQVLGLGLGAADARAADTGRPPHHPGRALGTVVRPGSDDGDPLDGPVGEAAGAAGTVGAVGAAGAAGAVDALDPVGTASGAGGALPLGSGGDRPVQGLGAALGHHLGTGELPLPGHHADAFSLAAGLLSGVPPQSRPENGPRASRSGPANGREPDGSTAPGTAAPTVPAQRTSAGTPATTAAAALPAAPAEPRTPAPRPAPPLGTPAPRPAPTAPDRVALTAAPTRPAGEGTVAVLLPIAAGLLLTAAAMYKHRGLPGGGH